MTNDKGPMTNDQKKRKFSILVVDDTPENIDIMKNTLVSEYQVQAATSGRQALKLAASAKQPDLILLDIMMPEMDGYEVCLRLKSDKNTQDIPVIFVTAMSEAEDETKGLELGAVDYITKPAKQAIVKARVKTHLNLKLAHETLAKKNEELEEMAVLREKVERITRHDLKSPLSGIINIPDILMKELDLTEKQKHLLKTVTLSGYQMLEMINHSLDLYKMETGTYQYTPGIVELVSLLHNIIAEKEFLLQDKKISVDIMLHGRLADKSDCFSVQGETLLCYSLFANLLKNALEASPDKARITVSLEERDLCFIGVHNQGAVPEKIREHFFEQYVTAGKPGGTGLGTYSAKLMTETQGGGICLRTSEKTGTEVTVRLPKVAADKTDMNKTAGSDTVKAESSEIPLAIPPQSLLERFYDLSMLGDITGIKDTLNEIECLDEQYPEFAARLRNLANQFRSRKIREFLKEIMTPGKNG